MSLPLTPPNPMARRRNTIPAKYLILGIIAIALLANQGILFTTQGVNGMGSGMFGQRGELHLQTSQNVYSTGDTIEGVVFYNHIDSGSQNNAPELPFGLADNPSGNPVFGIKVVELDGVEVFTSGEPIGWIRPFYCTDTSCPTTSGTLTDFAFTTEELGLHTVSIYFVGGAQPNPLIKNYDTGEIEGVACEDQKCLVAEKTIYIQPEECEFDPASEVIVHEVFTSGEDMDSSTLRYPQVRICQQPSPTILRADTGQVLDSFEPLNFPYHVPPSQVVEIHYVATMEDTGISVQCSEGSWSANKDECRVSTLVSPCPELSVLTADGTCTTFSLENCPAGSEWNEEDQACTFSVCSLISDTAEWVDEFKQCGEQVLFEDACTYGIGETYVWEADKCIWNMGRTDGEGFPGRDVCDSLSSDPNAYGTVEVTPGSGLFDGICSLPPNPVIPDGTFYKQGTQKLWGLYGVTETVNGTITLECPTGTVYDPFNGNCAVVENQFVEQVTVGERTVLYERNVDNAFDKTRTITSDVTKRASTSTFVTGFLIAGILFVGAFIVLNSQKRRGRR